MTALYDQENGQLGTFAINVQLYHCNLHACAPGLAAVMEVHGQRTQSKLVQFKKKQINVAFN